MINFPRISISDKEYRWWALGVTIIGGFMSILDSSIVNIALPKMMAVFAVSTDKAEWILTAYLLTMGVLQPVTGYFSDRFGTRRMYLLSLMGFTIGSMLCGMAWSADSMIAFRVLQAIGGGLIIPVTMTIVYQAFPLEERNMALGIWGISAMVAPAVGPTLSGYLVQYLDWRLIFTINIPIGIIGYIAASMILRETPLHKGSKFDYGGFMASSLGLFCLLLALSKGVDDGWTSGFIIALFYTAFASLTLFVVIELNHENPMLDLRLFADWNFSWCSLLVFIGTIALYGGVFLVPLFLENMRGYSAMQTGILMLPSAVMTGLMMPVAARLADRFGAKPVVMTGMCILALSQFPLSKVDMDTTYATITTVMILRGLGLGLYAMPTTVLGMSNIPLNKISRASALNNSIKQIAGSLGIAILSTLLQNRQIYHLSTNAANINVASYPTRQMLAHLEGMLYFGGAFPAQTGVLMQKKALALIDAIVQRQSLIFAFDDTFFCLVVLCVIAACVAGFLKSVKSRRSGAPTMLE
jgi:DHA2 family multidrug resistance protein